ncbi:YfhO family protein [Olsenella massiliensis]|uniref:YfhO family protein n=1 Tax=Olsenella massiliensis TaxID=1622075 RepID=UPI00071D35F6|nr:YfhO family protein [Olsenella massiliensis]
MEASLLPYLIGVLMTGGLAAAVLFRCADRLMTASWRVTRAEAAVLGVVVLAGVWVVYGRFLVGARLFAYYDVGSDTSEQYVPYYLSLLRSIRDGSLGLWNADYGLGTSFMSYQSWTLDPFNLVLIPLCLAFGDGLLGGALAIVQALKVVCCAFLFDRLLCGYCRLPLSRVLGASLFAFCGYLVLWGQHYWLGTVLVMATLLTLLLELLMRRWSVPRFLGVTCAVAATVMMSTYSGFMVMLYASAYAALRLPCVMDAASPATYARCFGRLAAPVICGLLVSMLTVVPYATLLLGESARVSGTGTLVSRAMGYLGAFVPVRWVLPVLSRLLGSTLISAGSDIPPSVIPPTAGFGYVNVYEFVQMGFSGFSVMLLGQFFHWELTGAERRERTLAGIAALICALYCLNFFLPALSNLFVEPKYRSSFALAIPLCLAMAVGWERRVAQGRPSRPTLLTTGGLTLVVIGWSLAHTVDGHVTCLVYLVSVAGGIALLLCLGRTGARRNVALVLLCALALFGSVTDAFMATNHRATGLPDRFPAAVSPGRDKDTRAALAWVRAQGDGFVRVEKRYRDWTRLNDALVQGYAGVSSYNSTLDSDVIDFYRQLWPRVLVGESAYQEFLADPDQPALLRLLGVRYLLSHDDLAGPAYDQRAQFGSVRVYEVLGAACPLSVRRGVVRESDAALMDAEGRRELLAASVIVPDEVADSLERQARPTGQQEVGGHTVDGPDGPIAYDPAPAWLCLAGADRLSGAADADVDGSVACLSVPHTLGWRVSVDGREVPTFRVNYGFVGFALTAGHHQVEARYEAPNASLGVVLAGMGVCLATACCAVGLRLRRRGDAR